jgi:hypothetical protein
MVRVMVVAVVPAMMTAMMATAMSAAASHDPVRGERDAETDHTEGKHRPKSTKSHVSILSRDEYAAGGTCRAE